MIVPPVETTAQDYRRRIQVLMAHNLLFIESGLASNITYVLLRMGDTEFDMYEGFRELKFWFSEGMKCGAVPEAFYRHIMRYVERGINLYQQRTVA